MMLSLLRVLPKNVLSYLFGLFSRLLLPSALLLPLLRWFAERYKVNLDEMEKPLESYRSLSAFFSRNLKAGIRQMEEGLVSPVDGKLVRVAAVEEGQLIQAKEIEYSLEDLLASKEKAELFSEGCYATIYLAPGDYHKIHAPCDAEIVEATHIPGTLWPVNEASVESIPALFAVNERVVTYLKTETGFFAIVKVGATNVGSITCSFCSIRANDSLFVGRSQIESQSFEPGLAVKKGDTLASFNMGSTVVLLSTSDFSPEARVVGEILLGQGLAVS